MKRVDHPVTLAEAEARLRSYRESHGIGPHPAAVLAEVIWPEARFIRAQGAGAAATRVLKRLGCYWTMLKGRWGWVLYFNKDAA